MHEIWILLFLLLCGPPLGYWSKCHYVHFLGYCDCEIFVNTCIKLLNVYIIWSLCREQLLNVLLASRRRWLLQDTWSHLWFTGVHKCPPLHTSLFAGSDGASFTFVHFVSCCCYGCIIFMKCGNYFIRQITPFYPLGDQISVRLKGHIVKDDNPRPLKAKNNVYMAIKIKINILVIWNLGLNQRERTRRCGQFVDSGGGDLTVWISSAPKTELGARENIMYFKIVIITMISWLCDKYNVIPA